MRDLSDQTFVFFFSSFFNFLMLSIKDWTSLVQSLVDSGCTISAEVKVRVQTYLKLLSFLTSRFLSVLKFFFLEYDKSFFLFFEVIFIYSVDLQAHSAFESESK